ncbi:MAG: universal stress protein [Bacteroidetes bacterium]|nr:universal stress protein [Bacteroidota bacterium]
MKLQERGIILIPVDFTEQSIFAIKQSYNLAKYTHSRIVILHTYEKVGEERYEELKKLTKETETESGAPCEFMNIKGNIYKETLRVAEEIKATMIMVGLESHMNPKQVVGESASKMIRESKCPVISIRGREHRDGCENILLPLDLSRESREKVDVAIQFAHYFGASIRILGVFSLSDAAYENQLLAYSHQVKQYIKSKGISCTNKSLASDSIAETVVEYANKIEADLIIIMNKPNLSMKEFFSGTEAQKVVDISNLPVMTINPEKKESMTHFGTGL